VEDGLAYYGSEDGETYQYVASVVEDRQGSLWFGTGSGIDRYEAEGFKSFSIDGQPLNSVKALLEDRQGILWFGTLGKVLRVASEERRFCRYDGQRLEVIAEGDTLGDGVWRMVYARRPSGPYLDRHPRQRGLPL